MPPRHLRDVFSKTQKAITWVFVIILISAAVHCTWATRVLTRNWGPQSMMYLKGKHGRGNSFERERRLYASNLIGWINNVNSVLDYQKSKRAIEEYLKELDV